MQGTTDGGIDNQKLMLARAVVQNLIRKGVRLLALDFDLTIIGIHTGGAWRGTTHQLMQHVRPCFRLLLEAALETPDIHVSVVTYSHQQGTIEDLLRHMFPYRDTGRILVRTSCKDWMVKKNQPAKHVLGKQQHIAQVTTDLYNLRHAVIQPQEILLIDDDEENINIARHFGHLGFLVKENVTIEDIYTFVETVKGCGATSNSSIGFQDPAYSVMYNPKHGMNVTDYQTLPLQRPEYSAQVFLTSSNNPVLKTRQDMAVPDMNSASSFTIPRPAVTNEQLRRNLPDHARVRRSEVESVPQNSSVSRNGSKSAYIVMAHDM